MDRKQEYAVRRRAAEDVAAQMNAAGKEREARKAHLLVDSLDLFYSDVGGGHGPSPVDMTNPYFKKDYERAHAEVLDYVHGGIMPWIRGLPHDKYKTDEQKHSDTCSMLPELQMSVGRPIEKKPLTVEITMELARPISKKEVREKLSLWRDAGTVTAFVYNKSGKVFRFDGRVVLTRGKYMLRSAEDVYMPVEDMLINPDNYEPPLEKIGFNLEKRPKTGPVGGVWPD